MTRLSLKMGSLHLSDEQFWQICRDNPDLQFERDTTGNLIILSPTGGTTGNRNGRLTQQLFNWSDNDGTGIAC